MKCSQCSSPDVIKLFDACNIHGRHVVNSNDIFEICKCNNCNLVYIPHISVDSVYYSKYYNIEDYYNNGSQNRILNRLGFILNSILTKIKEKAIMGVSKGKNRLRLLDIGCGNGEFLQRIDDEKFEKHGIEINLKGYEICKSKNIDVHNKELKDLDFEEGYFDIITAWHVIEHISNPLELLKSVRRNLNGDGVFAISTPNTKSIGFRYGRKQWFHLDTPRHLQLYSEDNLEIILKKAGFKVENKINIFYEFPLDLFWSLRRSKIKYIVYPFYPLFKWLDRETLCFVCRKL